MIWVPDPVIRITSKWITIEVTGKGLYLVISLVVAFHSGNFGF